MPETFDQLRNPEEARFARRRHNAIETERLALDAELDVASAEALRPLAPNRLDAVGAQLEGAMSRAVPLRARATEARDLAGFSDADYPWATWVKARRPGDPSPAGPGMEGPSYRDQLSQWEEIAVQRDDEAAHPTAYDIDPDEARFNLAVAEARISALRDLIGRLDDLARQNEAKENRAGRRARAGSSSAPDVPSPPDPPDASG